MARFLNILGVAVLIVGALAGQQSYPPASPAPMGDPTEALDQEHGAARISFLSGDANLQRGGSSDLVAAVVNAPLLSHDRLQTAPQSSAEVQLDGWTLVRLAENTDLGLGELQSGRAQLQVGAGTVIFRVLRDSQLQTDIETPSVAIHPLGPVDLRISVLENGLTQVVVRAGAANIYGPGGTQRLEAPRAVLVRANASGPEFQELALSVRDPLDDWSASRDNQLLSAQSYQYTGGEMAGVGDLDANGAWVSSQYGPVWAPRTADPGWAPYSTGQWVDEPYYGWTWVDSEPWGWAPFHYGRWFWNGGRGWCWWPGAAGFRPAWGPAYVGFFGFGGGSRGLGWVALAPYEGFHSWWGRGGYRGNGGFYSERSGVFGNYQNAAFRGGAVGASFAAFGAYRGRFNPVPRESVIGATLIRGRLPVNSAGYRFHFVDRPGIANPRLASAGSQTFFQGPRYQTSRAGFSSTPGYSGYRGTNSAAQSQYRAAPQYRTSPSSGRPSGGWQQFGNPNTLSGTRQGFTANQGESGWHQFGQPQPSRSYSQPSYREYGGSQPSYRQSGPSYHSGSGFQQSAPSYHSAAPSYQAPSYHSAPSYNAPPSYRPSPSTSGGSRSYGGSSGGGYRGGGGAAPRSQGDGSGGNNSHGGGGGGGGHHR